MLASACLPLLAQAQPIIGLPNITTAADSLVTFNEIQYHPDDDNPALEWIELYNDMSIDMELSNWVIEGGMDFRFPANSILAANSYLVVAADPVTLSTATGITNVVGPFTRRLANSGDTLRLRNHNNRLIDEITYNDGDPWPILADGTGLSLAKRDRFMASSPAGNWRASQEIGGTPGRVNFTVAPIPASTLVLNEVAEGGSPSFFLELANRGEGAVNLSGFRLASSSGAVFPLPSQTIGAGQLLVFGGDQLGFTPDAGQKLFLRGPDATVLDGVAVKNRPQARSSTAHRAGWFVPSAPTPGAANQFLFHDEIVINEILYNHLPHYSEDKTQFATNDEQWIELYNRSASAVNLEGWRLADSIDFVFPKGAVLAPDGYVVVARDAAELRSRHSDISILGDFKGKLSHHAGRIVLRDALGNLANAVSYFNDHPWPSYPNGGGSSLELRDPRMDNSVPEAWAASVEGGKSAWRRYSYRANAIAPRYTPAVSFFNEFRLGLLAEGEVLIDNINVTELPVGLPARQLLQNSNFTGGLTKWRKLGDHSHSFVEPRQEDPSDPLLHLVATGSMSYLDNRLETTLKVGTAFTPVVVGRQYEISFDAKWLAGSPQLHTELYYNKVTKTTLLDTPDLPGTPGRRNSTHTANAGPTFTGLWHTPVIPKPAQEIIVGVQVEDPDGVAGLRLFYSVKGAAWLDLPMFKETVGSAVISGRIPPQARGAVIQFYVSGTDTLGAISTYPARGPSSRALVKVDTTRILAGKQTLRTVMTVSDAQLMHVTTNLMSDDLLGCTVVHNENEVFYDAHIRLHGSMWSRTDPTSTGMTVKFPADHLFRGTRGSVIARRRGLVETFVKHIVNAVGGLPANYDDIAHFVSHRTDNLGTARLNLANYDDTYVDSQFEGNNGGTVFKLEGIREYQATDNGNPEGYKLPMPIGWIQRFDIANLGDDPEQYRWSILIQSRKARDDYSQIVAMGKAMSLSGAALHDAAAKVIDVDEWARLFAVQNLMGIGDVYGVENPHNFCFYVRPDDGRVVGLQNDWEFAFSQGAGASIYGAQNVYKMLKVPGFKRLYHGHLLDMINTVYTGAYLTRWAKHFSTVTGEGYNSFPAYANSRGVSVRNQLKTAAPTVPFEITSNAGADFTVETPTVALEGRAWIDVHDIRLAGGSKPLPVVWLDDARWQIVLPLKAGANLIQVEGFGYRGQLVAGDSITVTTTLSEFPQRDYIRISEIMYHPDDPTADELGAGFGNSDDFEFIELINSGPVGVSLVGAKFTRGVAFDFTGGAVPGLAPGQRVVIVKNAAAFAFRHGTVDRVVGVYSSSLNNAGEVIRLEDSAGIAIQEFAYQDAGGWPEIADGFGSSLEVVDLKGNYGDPANWLASAVKGGTPGLPPAAPPSFASVAFSGDQVRLKFQSAPRQSYSVWRRDNFAAGAWEIFQTFPAGQVGILHEVTDIPSGQTRFYRLSSP